MVFTNLYRHGFVKTFHGKAQKILKDDWYHNRKQNKRAESLRIVKLAAEIVRDYIKVKAYATETYAATDVFFKNLK